MTNLAGLLCSSDDEAGLRLHGYRYDLTTFSLGAVIARAFQGQLYDKFNPKIVTCLAHSLTSSAFVVWPCENTHAGGPAVSSSV